jgi:transcriptional regulator with XRE-family HTH domain
MFITASLQRIRDFKLATGWHLTELAKAASLNESTIRRLMDPGWNPTAATLRALEQAIERHGTQARPSRRQDGGPVGGVAA